VAAEPSADVVVRELVHDINRCESAADWRLWGQRGTFPALVVDSDDNAALVANVYL
jgi:hypothetical protein